MPTAKLTDKCRQSRQLKADVIMTTSGSSWLDVW